jgi:2-phospho-L-lactate/phosphoenolpyruvate guanylyltransferase
MPPARPVNWSLVIPVKVLALAKSRLAGLAGVTGEQRAELALAMAADTVAAAAACPRVAAVIVVTDDVVVGAEMEHLGAVVIGDEPARGQNAALVFGAQYADSRWPGRGRAALAADLPALGPGELAAALAAASVLTRAFVPDAEGTGTTLYTAAPGTAFCPRFGPRSRDRHLATGAVELDLPDIGGLRRDVDTPADLRQAADIGLGPRSAAVTALLKL